MIDITDAVLYCIHSYHKSSSFSLSLAVTSCLTSAKLFSVCIKLQ